MRRKLFNMVFQGRTDILKFLTPLPLGPIFFISMQFSGKFGRIIGYPLDVSAPHGNPGSAPVFMSKL